MRDFIEKAAHGNFHAQFLSQFTGQALLEGLGRLSLAAGEFPKSAEMRVRVPSGDEDFAIAKNQGGGNLNKLMIDD